MRSLCTTVAAAGRLRIPNGLGPMDCNDLLFLKILLRSNLHPDECGNQKTRFTYLWQARNLRLNQCTAIFLIKPNTTR